MKILTKMSIVLFVLLLGMTIGSVSIIDDLVRKLEDATWAAVHSEWEDEGTTCDTTIARIRLNALLAQLESRYQWLGSRLAWLAHDRDLEGAMESARGKTVLAPLLAARLETLRGEMASLWVVSSDGKQVRVVRERVRHRALAARKRASASVAAPLPGKLLPLATRVSEGVVAFDILSRENVLNGSVAGDEGLGEDGAARRKETGALLVLGVPVRSSAGNVVGAVFGALDLDLEELTQGGDDRGDSGVVKALALSVASKRRFVVGEGYAVGTIVPEATTAAIRDKKWFVSPIKSSVDVATVVDWAGAPSGTVVELKVARTAVGALDRRRVISAWAKPVRKASGLEALLGVLVLALGIEGARRATSPLNRLLKRADLVSTGKVDASFKDLSGRSEVGELARCFERMRISIHKLMDRHQTQDTESEMEAPSGSVTGEIRTESSDRDS